MSFHGLHYIFLAAFCSFKIFVTCQTIPSAPFLDLTVLSGTSVRTNFSAPLTDGGSAITSYKIDWDTDPGVKEIQQIVTSTYIGPNEVQVITSSADPINEKQVIF